MSMIRESKRNAFIALCELASKEDWCWKLYCTTCGSMYFRCSFMEMINGKHPDFEGWIIRKDNHQRINMPLPREFSKEQQLILLNIVADARVSEITNVAKFPDWLGYLGLVLFFCSTVEKESRLVTKTYIPQLLESVKMENDFSQKMKDILMNPTQVIFWQDLEVVEKLMERSQK